VGILSPPYVYITLAVVLVLGLGLGYWLRRIVSKRKLASAEETAEKLLHDARNEAKAIVREAKLEAKDEAQAIKLQFEKQADERRGELRRIEKWLSSKEGQLEKRESDLDERLEEVKAKGRKLEELEASLASQEEHLIRLVDEQTRMLEHLSGVTAEEAKALLLENLRAEVEHESVRLLKEMREEAQARAEDEARKIITNAVQRIASDQVSEITVSVVQLPSDEMKGRVIGREGRNIRAFEMATGVDVVVDDTPEAVILSAFDPVKREIARQTMERLVQDGRIHPGRIEDIVGKVSEKMKVVLREAGEQAALETHVQGLAPELVNLLGRLRYRTSFGQNVMAHSVEVSHLCGMMAAELGLDEKLARRAGLLHDIGKAVDHEVEGTHAQIGADLARRYEEKPAIVNAIEAHHDAVEVATPEAVLVMAADALSAARPGARRETLDLYIKRLTKLEEIADSFSGVERSFAIQAGREIRIIVDPADLDDLQADEVSHLVARRIEKEMEYPGKIKVTVIREHRATDYAS
jgi:ribonuclease Y